MTGKIFFDTNNIYEDQAKVLFDYYKEAATKIVNSQIELERKIEVANIAKNKEIAKKKKAKIFTIIATAISGLLLTFFLLQLLNIIPTYAIGIIPDFSFKDLSVLLVVIFIIISIVQFFKFLKAKKGEKSLEDNITAFSQAKDDIRTDYKVNKLGIVYVPVALNVPFENKSFTVDYTGTVKDTTFSLSIPKQTQELQKSLGSLEHNIEEVPIIETNKEAENIDTSEYSTSVQSVTMHDYMGNLDREVRNIGYLLGDSDSITVDLPVITPKGEEDKFLNEYGTSQTEDKPVLNVFDSASFDTKLSSFSKLNDMKQKTQNDNNTGDIEYYKTLMKKLGQTVQFLSQQKTYSQTKLLDYTNMIFSNVLKAGFNQYSPTLEAEEIARVREATFDFHDNSTTDYKPFNLKQSSRVRYDLFSNAWVAEDNSRTNMPFGANQIQEEILMPIIYNLMHETRIERLKIYNNINDQKLHYRNEWHKDVEDAFRDNRKTGQELLTQITQAFAEYNAAYQTYMSYKSTQDTLKASGDLADSEVQEKDNSAEQIAAFQAQAVQCNKITDDFQDYIDRLQEEIDQRTREFEYIEYYEASLRDKEASNVAKSIDIQTLQSLSPRRQKLVMANPYYAAFANLPPAPKVEEKLMEDFTCDVEKTSLNLLEEINALQQKNNVNNKEKPNKDLQEQKGE